jgi:hypothetical protein
MATGKPLQSKPCSSDRAIAFDGLDGILGACRGKPARRRKGWRYDALVEPDQEYEEILHGIGEAARIGFDSLAIC